MALLGLPGDGGATWAQTGDPSLGIIVVDIRNMGGPHEFSWGGLALKYSSTSHRFSCASEGLDIYFGSMVSTLRNRKLQSVGEGWSIQPLASFINKALLTEPLFGCFLARTADLRS